MKNILIVEDEESLLQLYRMEFEEEGYQVTTASDGAEALRIMQEKPAELVIMDLALPDGSGLEVITRMLEIDADLKVIINTAYNHFKADFHSWSADAYIVKSSNLDELKETVRELLDCKSAA